MKKQETFISPGSSQQSKDSLHGGYTLPSVLGFIIAIGLISTAVLTVIMTNFSTVGNHIKSQQSFNVAEAGVNYYLWHLAHSPTDYKDGQATPATPDPQLGYGPYAHSYIDSNATDQGTFTLWIKPQGAGSTIVNVRSIGMAKGSNIKRTVEAQIGATSFASYALLADVEFWFGDTEAANGPVFSNQGVHMDGPNSDTVGSARSTYVPLPQYGGDGSSKSGVWCSLGVLNPNCATRDKSNWLYPQPSIDFNQISTSLCTMKKTAFASDPATVALASLGNACSQVPATRTPAYIPRNGSTFSKTKGYLVELNTNNTYNLSRVSAENDRLTPYTSALTRTAVASNIAVPTSGVIFVEDNVWVRTNPTFHGRVTIAAGQLASSSNSPDINIADDVLYSVKNGEDAIGLVAEDDIIVAPYAPPASGSFTFEINAATLSQLGSVTWPDRYKADSSRCTRGWVGANQKFVYYGSVATRQYWTWNYLRGACGDAVYDSSINRYVSGVRITETNYDYNLLYAPPPSYPITGGYTILSWREVLTKP
ncbi:hypothetical protein IPL85_01240 [Candidatus Saccharibacteria bacterium]|nr:MAG: hypothetical protein IPL85_01240 [Candidatus Saccharibacteria bacterium]